MSLRSNGSYIGPRPAGPTNGGSGVASGIWDLRTAQRQRAANTWPFFEVPDPYFSNVELLLHFDNNLTDSSSSPKTVTASNGAATSATKSKWGGYSCSFDGSNDFLTVPDSASFQFGSGNFVIEAWCLWESVATYQMLWQKHTKDLGASGNAFFLRFDGAVSPKRLNLAYCIGGSQYEFNGSFSPNTNQWYHIAIVRSGNDWSIYADGSRVATENRSGTLNTGSGQNLRIGGTAFYADTMFRGYIDDFRVTKGSDRGYTGASITVPTAAFPNT